MADVVSGQLITPPVADVKLADRFVTYDPDKGPIVEHVIDVIVFDDHDMVEIHTDYGIHTFDGCEHVEVWRP